MGLLVCPPTGVLPGNLRRLLGACDGLDQVQISPACSLRPGFQMYWVPSEPAFGRPESAETDRRRSSQQGTRPPWPFSSGSWRPTTILSSCPETRDENLLSAPQESPRVNCKEMGVAPKNQEPHPPLANLDPPSCPLRIGVCFSRLTHLDPLCSV